MSSSMMLFYLHVLESEEHFHRIYCVKCRAEVYEEYVGVGVLRLQMFQDVNKCQTDISQSFIKQWA